MAIMNISMARLMPNENALSCYVASQQLMDILIRNRFHEISASSVVFSKRQHHYARSQAYFFRKHGECTVNFLKDGRVHVLNGPIAIWNLHDALTTDELRILIAFATLSTEQQEVMRNYMAPRCSQSAIDRRYTDVLSQMPAFNVDWKQDFLIAYRKVDMPA